MIRFAARLHAPNRQEFAEERKHVVRQHAAEVQELSDIIAAVEVRGLYLFEVTGIFFRAFEIQ